MSVRRRVSHLGREYYEQRFLLLLGIVKLRCFPDDGCEVSERYWVRFKAKFYLAVTIQAVNKHSPEPR